MSKQDTHIDPQHLSFLRELSHALQTTVPISPLLQDPPMSPPSAWSSIKAESLLNKLDTESLQQAWAFPQAKDILQRFMSLESGCSHNHNAEQVATVTVKVEGLYHDTCTNMKSAHGVDDEQLREANTPHYHIKERRARDPTTTSRDRSTVGKVRRPLSSLPATKALANEKRQSRSLPLSAPKVMERHSEGRQKNGQCIHDKGEGLQGRLPQSTGKAPQRAIELTAKSKLRNCRSFRQNRVRRLRKSPTIRPRQKVQELLYTGLITPSRRPCNWKKSPHVSQITSDALRDGDDDELDISELPRSGCGTPWSWSRIHSKRSHIISKMVGMRMPCGLSDSLPKNVGRNMLHESSSSILESFSATTDISETSFNTDSESLPLLEANSPLQDCSSLQSECASWEKDGKEQQESYHTCSILKPGHQESVAADGVPAALAKGHQSLNQKYMPKSFQDVVGQNLVTQALCNALSRGKIAPIYIFYGPRGTGKTSCAKLFAAALNCLSLEGRRPCGTCFECEVGKYSKVKEYNVGGKNGTRGIKLLMHDVIWSSSSHYVVYVVNACHTLTSQSWAAFLKVVEEAPKNIVFILSTSSLEPLPHEVVSRCQKYLFSKIKESEIANKLQSIAVQEGMEADAEAIKLIASTCDGSLRDAETMLDQLSLLGQKISISIVQELMGLIPDNKLVDLLDFALSADTVNTVRSLKQLMVSGAEPLNLMSQLACLITSMLAGDFQISTEMRKGKFFHQELTKEGMERLRQALKTLSEAEKQLRDSSDRTTWLTAALLQFAPDQSYLHPRSSSNTTSVAQTPEGPSDTNGTPDLSFRSKRRLKSHSKQRAPTCKDAPGTTTECASNEVSDSSRFSLESSLAPTRAKNHQPKEVHSTASKLEIVLADTQADEPGATKTHITTLANQFDMEDVWQRFLDTVHSSSLRKFLMAQGKLVSLSLSKGVAVAHLEFGQVEHTSRATRSRASIAYAFHCTLGYPVDIKISLASATAEHLKQQASIGDQLCSSSSLWHSSRNVNANNLTDRKAMEDENGLRRDLPAFCMSSACLLELHRQSIPARPNLSFEILPPEMRHPNTLLPSSQTAKKKHAEAEDVCHNGDGDDEHKQDNTSSLNIFRIGGSDLGYTMAQEAHSAMVAAQQLDDDTMRLESKTGTSCWNASGGGNGLSTKAKQLPRTSKRSGLFLTLCPCATSSH